MNYCSFRLQSEGIMLHQIEDKICHGGYASSHAQQWSSLHGWLQQVYIGNFCLDIGSDRKWHSWGSFPNVKIYSVKLRRMSHCIPITIEGILPFCGLVPWSARTSIVVMVFRWKEVWIYLCCGEMNNIFCWMYLYISQYTTCRVHMERWKC